MNELNDTQIALIIKNALEFNATIIASASMIYKQDLKQYSRQKAYNGFTKKSKQYAENIDKVLKGDF